jgi:hypothetical protein
VPQGASSGLAILPDFTNSNGLRSAPNQTAEPTRARPIGEQVLRSVYLRRIGMPRGRRGLLVGSGFIAAANCPPTIKRYPLPAHPMHSMPACKPVPRHWSHGTGILSPFGGLTDIRFHAVSRPGRSENGQTRNRVPQITPLC